MSLTAKTAIQRHLDKLVNDLDRGKGSGAYEPGLPRVMVDKKRIKQEEFERAGFTPTLLAIPEPGQATQVSWRHPQGHHVHDHGSHWIAHKDRHSPLLTRPHEVVQHMLFEGAPGLSRYAYHKLTGGAPLVDVLGRSQKLPQRG